MRPAYGLRRAASGGRTPQLSVGNNITTFPSVATFRAIVDTIIRFDHIPINAKVGSLIYSEDAFVDIGDVAFSVCSVVLPGVRIGTSSVIGANCGIKPRSVRSHSRSTKGHRDVYVDHLPLPLEGVSSSRLLLFLQHFS